MPLKHKIVLIFLLLGISFTSIKAQFISNSPAYIQVCYFGENCFSISQSARIFYDESKHEIYVLMDMADFKTGQDTLDNWLKQLESTKFLFKGTIKTDYLVLLSNHNSKSETIKGSIHFNKITKQNDAVATFYDVASGIMNLQRENGMYGQLRVNMSISFAPKDFGLDKKKKHFSKTIEIQIGKGFINSLLPGMEDVLKDYEEN